MTTRQYLLMGTEDGTGISSKSTPMVEIPRNNSVTSSSNNLIQPTNNIKVEAKCENNVELDDDMLDGKKKSPRDEFFLCPQAAFSQSNADNTRIQNTNGGPSMVSDDDSYQYEPAVLPPLYDAKEKKYLTRLRKYESFGEFLVSSLCDLPDLQAMKLIEKITYDIIWSFFVINNGHADASVSTIQSNHNNLPVTKNVETIFKEEQDES